MWLRARFRGAPITNRVRIYSRTRLVIALAVALAARAQGATFVVTNTNNSGAGSLREAVDQANATPAADIIHFNIPGAGVHTIDVLPAIVITAPVTIDGYSQPGASANTLALGDNAVLLIQLHGHQVLSQLHGLIVQSQNCTIKGLVLNGFRGPGPSIFSAAIYLEAGNNVVTGNFIGTNAAGTGDGVESQDIGIDIVAGTNNIIGGTTAAARNLISNNGWFGISIEAGSGHVVQGNYIGTDATGGTVGGQYGNATGLEVLGGSGHIIGGTAVGAGNVISANYGHGILLESTTATLVQGNLIGIEAAGAEDGNILSGILIGDFAQNSTIGGTVAAARNIISGNHDYGVEISGANATGNLVRGNFIGTDISGTTAIPNILGGVFVGADGNTIGGSAVGAGNLIAFNSGAGVSVVGGQSDRISSNAIHSNATLGIDLGNDGVTPNDNGDGDSGPNSLQNFPVIGSAVSDFTSTTITGTLNSNANTDFRIELFANTTADSSGYGEGATFLGSAAATTNGSGNAGFSVSFPVAFAHRSRSITATAINLSNDNTSEFSQAVRNQGSILPEDESNNNAGTATALNLGAKPCTIFEGAIAPGADVDFFSFSTATTNARVWAYVDTGGVQNPGANSRDSVLQLRATDGVTLLEQDDNDGSGNGGDGVLESGAASAIAGKTLASAGTYFLRVAGATASDVIDPYRLLVIVTTASGAESEPNNTAATATSIATSASPIGVRRANINAAGDVDFYSVQANAGDLLFVETDGDPERDGTGTDVIVELYDTNGSTLLFQADSSGLGSAGDPPAEAFSYAIPTAGTYYFRVRHSSPSATGTYDVMAALCSADVFVYVSDVVVTEGNSGMTTATFNVTLSGPLPQVAIVDIVTADGTATATSDYEPDSGSVIFLPGQTSEPFTVEIDGDSLFEPPETFFLNITATTANLAIGDGQGLGTIVDSDSDADGVPDDFETTYGLNPNDPADATQDSDGDGMTNLKEYLTCTIPNDPTSYFRITEIKTVGNDVHVKFAPTCADKKYRVEFNTDLGTASWRSLADGLRGTGGTIEVVDFGSAIAPTRFYRAVLP
jgi:hypothetical protein